MQARINWSQAEASQRADPVQAIERQIMGRTWGRIRDLAVRITPERVVVHGHASTYYVKQLAIQAVLDVVEANQSAPVDFDIDVVAVV
jgi:hypothetical protein